MKNKFSERQFFLFGLNYIIGFGFIATISSIVSIGAWGALVFSITAFIAGVVMLTFSRAATNFQNEEGGSYLYAKKTFGKGLSFFQGWNQFSQVILFSSTSPLFFSRLLTVLDPKNEILYSIISVSIFIGIILISYFGISLSKKVILVAASIKWIIIFMAIGIIIYLATQDLRFTKNMLSNKEITPTLIASTVLFFIYSFGGAEGLAGLSSTVETKRFKKILFSIFLIVLTFYFIFYLIFLSVDPKNGELRVTFNAVMGLTGSIIYIVGIFFNRFATSVSSMLYYTRIFSPLAQDGYFPKWFTKKNKNGEYGRISFLVLTIMISSMILFTVLPKILGVADEFGTILRSGNISFLMQYFFTILTVLVLGYKNKKYQVPIWEQILYYLAMVAIIACLLLSMFPVVTGDAWTISNTILVSSYFGVIFLGYVFWAIYALCLKIHNKRQLNTRKNNDAWEWLQNQNKDLE